MNDADRFVGPLSTGFIMSCAAWSVPQGFVGRYVGFFPESVQSLLSFAIVAALAGWAVFVGVDAIRTRLIPWRAIVLAVGSFVVAELVWRLFIGPLPGGDFKLAWVLMLFAQPIVAGLGVIVLARGWLTLRRKQADQS